MAALTNICGALCWTPPSFGWRPVLKCPAVTLSILENVRFGRKLNFAPGKIPSGGNNPRKCIYSVPSQETAKHHAKFGWPPLSDVGAVTKQRRKTCWNLLGCPKLTNRFQPLVGWSSLYCDDTWRRYCYLTFFSFADICLSCVDIARQSCAMVRKWRIFGDFLRPVFFSDPPAAHFRPAF